MQVVFQRQRLARRLLAHEAYGTTVASLDQTVSSALGDQLHRYRIALDLGDEDTGVEFAVGGVRHDQFQVIGRTRLHGRERAQARGDAIVLDVLATGVVMEITGVRTVVDIVDRHGLAGPGNEGDILVNADTGVPGNARTTDEEAEDIIVL